MSAVTDLAYYLTPNMSGDHRQDVEKYLALFKAEILAEARSSIIAQMRTEIMSAFHRRAEGPP